MKKPDCFGKNNKDEVCKKCDSFVECIATRERDSVLSVLSEMSKVRKRK